MSGSILSDINYVVVGASDTAPLGRVGIGYINASVGRYSHYHYYRHRLNSSGFLTALSPTP